MSRALRGSVSLGPLVFASLALGHELIYLLVHGSSGYARAMVEAGHDRYWATFVLAVGVLGLSLAVAAAAQLRRLRALANAVRDGSVQVTDAGVDRYAALVGPLWLRVGAWTTAAYFLQENIETATTGHALPGIAVFGSEHAVALPVIVVVSLVVAAVRALVQWRREILLARIRAAGRRRPRASAVLRGSHLSNHSIGRVEGRQHGVRAPPGWTIAPA